MEFYETTYILHSALQEGRLNDIIGAIENKVKSLGAEILYSDNWGRKKLAYFINKEKYGTYIFFQFKLENSEKLKDLSSEFEHNPNVLRYLNIKIDEDDVLESVQKDNIKSNVQDKSKTEKKLEVKDQSNEENQKQPDNETKSDENDNVVEKEEK